MSVQIGKLGPLRVQPGFYIYIGSAFGPGGVISRVKRHCRTEKSKHWHIDYLREVTSIHTIWYTLSNERLEHKWADKIAKKGGFESIKGFGSSDCQCNTHLFYSGVMIDQSTFKRAVGNDVELFICN